MNNGGYKYEYYLKYKPSHSPPLQDETNATNSSTLTPFGFVRQKNNRKMQRLCSQVHNFVSLIFFIFNTRLLHDIVHVIRNHYTNYINSIISISKIGGKCAVDVLGCHIVLVY